MNEEKNCRDCRNCSKQFLREGIVMGWQYSCLIHNCLIDIRDAEQCGEYEEDE